MNRTKWWFLLATLMVALFTTRNVEAETAEEVIERIRDGVDPHGAIEMWGVTITFPGTSEPTKKFVRANRVEDETNAVRADVITPESIDGSSSASVGLRYMATLKPRDLLAAGIAYWPDYRRTRPWKPPVMKPVLADVPIPFFWLHLSGYLTKYPKWELAGNTVFSIPPPENWDEKGNPRSLPRVSIEYFRKQGAYLISKLTIEDGIKYVLAFEGYGEVREGEFRPETIIASGPDGTVRVVIDPIWYLGERDLTAVFSTAAFQSNMLSVADFRGGEETAKAKK